MAENELKQRPELAHLTIEDLADEIGARCPCVVVLAVVPEQNSTMTKLYRYGNRHTQVGLMTLGRDLTRRELLNEAVESREKREDDDDEEEQ